jgi:hypothetical protein
MGYAYITLLIDRLQCHELGHTHKNYMATKEINIIIIRGKHRTYIIFSAEVR